MNTSGVDLHACCCVSPHMLRVFVYHFRDENEREARQKNTGQLAASAACTAHFEIQLTYAVFNRNGCLAGVFSASPLKT